MLLDCMICLAMYGSGVQTGIMMIISKLQNLRILKDQTMVQKRSSEVDLGLVMMHFVTFQDDTNLNQITEILILVFDVLKIYNTGE